MTTKKIDNPDVQPDSINLDSIRAMTHIRLGRYILITSWAIALLPIVGWRISLMWFVATTLAGVFRTVIEHRLTREENHYPLSKSKAYPLIVMGTNIFWAAAPALCLLSDHPVALEIALLFFASGYMLVVAQFNSSPRNFMIVSAPYTIVVLWLLMECLGTDKFLPFLAALPFLSLSVYYSLIFGYFKYRTKRNSELERSRLIEELKEARLEAERASEAKSMFLANMSHEIRTPMNGVIGMTELLKQTELNERQQFYSDTIHKSGTMLIAIINDILDLSKIEAGRLELEEAPFDLKAEIGDMAALMSTRAREKNLELIIRIPPSVPTNFIGDSGRIRQVITNLIGNAIKFTEQGYVLINVTGEEKDDKTELVIEIEDTGIGIPAQKCERIFDTFQQADSSTTRHYGGTGLGLSISKLLVEAMDGEIGVTSTPEKGSTFWVKLTLATQEQGDKVNMTDFAHGENRRVLVVDDIEVNRIIVTEILNAANFDTDIASSGKDALVILREASAVGEPFDLLISDYLMPEMDGEMLAHEIRNDATISQTPILVLTSVDEAEHVKRIHEIGIQGLLVKPAQSKQLLQTVKAALETNEALNPELVSQPQAAPMSAVDCLSSDGRIRVLLAEDNEVNQLVVKHMLDAKTYDLTIASNGVETLEKFKSEPKFDFILMDVSMPEMDGYEATTAIRKIEKTEDRSTTPIICLSAHVMTKDVAHSAEIGMDDFLAKPISQEKLEQITEKWVIGMRNTLKSA